MKYPILLAQFGSGTSSAVLSTDKVRDRLQLYLKDQSNTLAQDRDRIREQDRQVYQDQDRVVLATDALTKLELLVPGTDPQVASLAAQIQNTTKNATQAELRIRNRSQLTRYFIGGDIKSATQLLQITNQNLNRIQKLSQFITGCQCSSDVRATLQNQIQNMTQEQNRLRTLAKNEQRNHGIFGWIFNGSV